MESHFVTFCSPGTFVAETTCKEIASWSVKEALAMARGINERHGAKPFGFYFSTRGRSDTELDSREIKRSPFHYLGGVIETLEEVEARATEKDAVLLSNMRGNGTKRIITNDNSWRFTAALKDDYVVLPWDKDAK